MPTLEDEMTSRIVDKNLVYWLLKQGADKRVSYDFVLEKGMGERMSLTILNSTTVELTWFAAPLEESK